MTTTTTDRITVIHANGHYFAVANREVADRLDADLTAKGWEPTWGRVTPKQWQEWRPTFVSDVGESHIHESL